jgi:hypothetical protein
LEAHLRREGKAGGADRRRPGGEFCDYRSDRGEGGDERQTRKREQMTGWGQPGGVGSERIGAVHGRKIEVKRF